MVLKEVMEFMLMRPYTIGNFNRNKNYIKRTMKILELKV